jgi:predicted permease
VGVADQGSGFDAARTLTAGVTLEGERYRDEATSRALWDGLVAGVRALPGVREVGLTSKLPFRGGSNGGVLVKDRVYDPNVQDGIVEYTFVGEDYHESMGIPLLAGRNLEKRDLELAAAAAAASEEEGAGPLEVPVVINRAMAERYWPDEDPLGEIIRPDSREAHFRATVVGVVESVRQWGPEREAVPEMFFPYTGEVWGVWDLYLTVRTSGDPAALAPSIRETIREVDPSIPTPAPYTMATVLEETTAGRKFSTLLVTLFAMTALILIISGTYGVVSYAVGQRTHEIGVRMTLGANGGKVAGLFLKQVAFLVLPGLGVGILGAWGVSRVTRSMVYGIEAMSPIHLALAGIVMITVALVATAVPVRRATGVDPLDALRAD